MLNVVDDVEDNGTRLFSIILLIYNILYDWKGKTREGMKFIQAEMAVTHVESRYDLPAVFLGLI